MCSFCYCSCISFIIIVSIIIIIIIHIIIVIIIILFFERSMYIDHQAVGARYRLEVTDLGLGVTPRDMLKMLLDWGYQVSREACQEPHTLYLILNYSSIS